MNKSLRVAMLSYHTCPLATLGGKDTGGMNVYVRDLTKTLGRLGVHVDVYTRSQDEHVPHVLHDLGYGNRVVHIPAGPEVPMSKQDLASYIPEFVNGILDFAAERDIRYDLIHSHYWMSGIAAKALKQALNVPYVHMFHTLGLMKNRIARTPAEMEGMYRISGELEVMKSADCIIAATPAEKSQIEYLYKTTINDLQVIPPGVDTSHFYPIPADEAKEVIEIPQDHKMILFVGRIEPLKGIETLIKAIAIMYESGFLKECPHHLSIIGGNTNDTREDLNSEMRRLINLSKEYKIEDLIIFLGKRSQDSLPYYYSAAEVVVMPSHYESFGMVALEAMACGTPVIASQVGGLAYLVKDGETGLVVPNDDPQALADSLMKVLCRKGIRNELSQNAAVYAQDYDWDIIAGKIINLYEGLHLPVGNEQDYQHTY